jgi:hypothetical protein
MVVWGVQRGAFRGGRSEAALGWVVDGDVDVEDESYNRVFSKALGIAFVEERCRVPCSKSLSYILKKKKS